MDSFETKENTLSETTAGQVDSDSENLRLVPVAESIRYRKRAQSAEKKIEDLTEQLAQARSESARIAEQMSDMRVEQQLTRKLVAAGAVDLEAAVLIAKTRMEHEAKADLDGVIEQLRNEKQYLFDNNNAEAVALQRTAGVKDRVQNNQTMLERAAKRAATTGRRTDLQEYLKLRRNFLY
jgi:hypothetical protein